MANLDPATLDALLKAAGVTPEQMRRLDAVVAATSRAVDGDSADAIATLTCAIALYAGLTRDAVLAITAAINGLIRARDAYAAASRPSSTPRTVPS